MGILIGNEDYKAKQSTVWFGRSVIDRAASTTQARLMQDEKENVHRVSNETD